MKSGTSISDVKLPMLEGGAKTSYYPNGSPSKCSNELLMPARACLGTSLQVFVPFTLSNVLAPSIFHGSRYFRYTQLLVDAR